MKSEFQEEKIKITIATFVLFYRMQINFNFEINITTNKYYCEHTVLSLSTGARVKCKRKKLY